MAYKPRILQMSEGGTGFSSNAIVDVFLGTTTASNLTGDGTVITPVCDTAIVNTGTAYNLSTGVFTAPATGYYLITIWVGLNGLTTLHTGGFFHLLTSARTYNIPVSILWGAVESANQCSIGGTMIVDMAASASAQGRLNVSGSTKSVGLLGGASVMSTFFQAIRIQ